MLYRQNGSLLTSLVESALAKPDIIEVKNRTLDGKFHIQVIGSSGTLVSVKCALDANHKAIIDSMRRTGETIELVFDGFRYKGLIDSDLNHERTRYSDVVMFQTSFTIMVQEEGVA